MEIREPQSLPSLLQQCRDTENTVLLAHPGDAAEPTHIGSDNRTVLIGPEGGFTESEVQLASEYNARQIAWPNSILRIETAALAFAARLRR